MAKVVSNTTPLLTLAGAGVLDILPRLYGTIFVPEQVVQEYMIGKLASDPDLNQLAWLQVDTNVALLPQFQALDNGEAAALSLAMMLPADFVLLDERRARRFAAPAHIVTVGSLGVLISAKKQLLLPFIRPIIEVMKQQGRYFSGDLIARVLQDVDE